MITITIPNFKTPSRNKTATAHWTKYYRQKEEIAVFITSYAPRKKIISPSKVTIKAYFKGKRSIDTSNIDDKVIIDGLMRAGFLKDDCIEENPIVIKMAFNNSGEEKLVIEIEKI